MIILYYISIKILYICILWDGGRVMAETNIILEQIATRCNMMNWSIYRLAKEADIPYSSLNNMFKRNTVPSFMTLKKICDGMNIPLSVFFKDIESNDDSLTVKLSKKQQELFNDINSLSEGKQNQVYSYVDGLREEG